MPLSNSEAWARVFELALRFDAEAALTLIESVPPIPTARNAVKDLVRSGKLKQIGDGGYKIVKPTIEIAAITDAEAKAKANAKTEDITQEFVDKFAALFVGTRWYTKNSLAIKERMLWFRKTFPEFADLDYVLAATEWDISRKDKNFVFKPHKYIKNGNGHMVDSPLAAACEQYKEHADDNSGLKGGFYVPE